MTLVPEFQFQRVFIEPWTTELRSHGLMALITFLVGATCGLIGNFLILRRMALMGDAISHSVLPGIATAFLLTGSRGIGAIALGAVGAAFTTHLLIEIISRHSRIKPDAAIGIAFSTLFAAGVVLIAVAAGMISMADTRTTPTAWRAETTEKASSRSSNRSSPRVGSDSTRANPGSKLTSRNSL